MDGVNGEAFRRVWERVTATDEHISLPVPAERELELLIDGERSYASALRRSQKHCPPRRGGVVSAIISAAEKRQKALQLEYFMRTGDMCPAKPACPRPGMGVLSLLRGACLDAETAAERYAAAGEQRGGGLAAVYARMGAERAEEAARLRAVIASMM